MGSFSYTPRAGLLMWGVSLTCSLEAGGCFILGFSLTQPMDVLTIPTAYQKTKQNKNKNSLSVGVSSLKKKIINKKVLNSLPYLMLASFCMEFLLKKRKP